MGQELGEILRALHIVALITCCTSATEEDHFTDKIVHLQIVIRAEILLTHVPNFFAIIDLTNGYGRKGGVPVDALKSGVFS